MIVDEGLHARERDGLTLEGQGRSVEVMRKDSERYRETGGWGFERFEGDNKTGSASAEVKAACFACHSKKKDRDLVLSEFRK